MTPAGGFWTLVPNSFLWNLVAYASTTNTESKTTIARTPTIRPTAGTWTELISFGLEGSRTVCSLFVWLSPWRESSAVVVRGGGDVLLVVKSETTKICVRLQTIFYCCQCFIQLKKSEQPMPKRLGHLRKRAQQQLEGGAFRCRWQTPSVRWCLHRRFSRFTRKILQFRQKSV